MNFSQQQFSIMLAILSVMAGGFISWVVGYEFWRKSIGKKTCSADIVVGCSPVEVWAVITSASNIPHLDWRGIMMASHQKLQLGEKLRAGPGLYGADRSIYFQMIDELKELRWGGEPYEWDHKLTLQAVQQGTRISLTRVFWPYIPGWFDFVISGFKNPHASEYFFLIKEDINRIKKMFNPNTVT